MSERQTVYATVEATGVDSGRFEPISLVLPLPPIENHLYATVGTRRVKSKNARIYALEVGHAVLVQHRGLQINPDVPLCLDIALYLKHDRDVTGCKVLQDSLATAFGFDDRSIVQLHVTKQVDRANPRAEVTLSRSADMR